MHISQVAAQLYTVREFIKTPAAIAQSMKIIRDIGFQAVQISGMGQIAESEMNRILKDNGLVCCATHEPGEVIRRNPEQIVERLQKLDCSYTAYPYPAGVDFSDIEAVRALARDLDRAGEVLSKAGQVLCYHNHAIEFVKVDGKPLLEHIYDMTNPANLQAEIDTYWVQFGGGNPVKWCERMSGRLPVIHMKDYQFTLENKPTHCEIGAGTLDFAGIVRAAESSGCKWFVIEQDTCSGNPFDSLRQSFEYVKANLVAN